MKLLTGECPGKLVETGPGDEFDSNPPGLGICGFMGELATNPPGLGCGIGLGLMLAGSDVGDDKLNEVAGLDPKLVCVLGWFMLDVCGLAGV
jgi:hypothetical protein